MKKSIATIATAFIMATSFSSFATEKENPLKDVSSNSIVSSYVEATTLGTTDLNKYLFTEDFEYSNSSNNESYGRKEYVNYLQKNKGLTYDCKTTYEILDESGQACIAKATMKFENFTRVDHVTLQKTGDGWKVSKVVTTYPGK